MTKRLVDGVIFQDRQFIAMSRLAQVIYLGLQHIADDDGNARWTPQEVKGLLFARDRRATPGFLAKAMKEVEALDDIDTYEKDGWRYLHSFTISVQRAKQRYHAKSDLPSYPDTGKQVSYLASLEVSSEISTEKVHSVGGGVVSQVSVGIGVGVVSDTPPQVTGIKFSIDWTDQDYRDFMSARTKSVTGGASWLKSYLVKNGMEEEKAGKALGGLLSIMREFDAGVVAKAMGKIEAKPRRISDFAAYLRTACEELKEKGG